MDKSREITAELFPNIVDIELTSDDNLDTKSRLQALYDDERAGFLPTTNREKNQAITFLDYMDHSSYPSHIAKQLQEIFVHQKNLVWRYAPDIAVNEARKAVMSVAFELGDYLINSVHQLDALTELGTSIDECPNPKVTLLEEIGLNHRGYAPLIRYIDISNFRKNGLDESLGFNPLKTREDRSPKLDPDKNKTIEDQYTSEMINPIVLAHVDELVSSMTIGQTRIISKEAISDQLKRRAYWEKIIRDTRLHGAAWIVGKKVLTNLDLPLRQ